jgi:hypothetical protein
MSKLVVEPKNFTGFVGVRPPGIPSKQEALLFDSIAMYHLDDIFAGLSAYNFDKYSMSELEYLYEKGLIQLAPIWLQQRESNVEDFTALGEAARDGQYDPQLVAEFITRLLCVEINTGFQAEAVPILLDQPKSGTVSSSKVTKVAEITLKLFPTPMGCTSWEQIFDFKSDPEARYNLLNLRRWMRNSLQSDKSYTEISEELEFHIFEYERHLKIHRMKYSNEVLKTLIKIPLEILENTVKVQLGKVADSIFSVQDQRIKMLEEESKIPGKEVAYIVQAKERFQ